MTVLLLLLLLLLMMTAMICSLQCARISYKLCMPWVHNFRQTSPICIGNCLLPGVVKSVERPRQWPSEPSVRINYVCRVGVHRYLFGYLFLYSSLGFLDTRNFCVALRHRPCGTPRLFLISQYILEWPRLNWTLLAKILHCREFMRWKG